MNQLRDIRIIKNKRKIKEEEKRKTRILDRAKECTVVGRVRRLLGMVWRAGDGIREETRGLRGCRCVKGECIGY